jgi:hypothetical protein
LWLSPTLFGNGDTVVQARSGARIRKMGNRKTEFKSGKNGANTAKSPNCPHAPSLFLLTADRLASYTLHQWESGLAKQG